MQRKVSDLMFGKIVMPAMIAMLIALAASSPVAAQQYVMDLYSAPAEGSQDWSQPLVVHPRDGGESRFNTTQPRLQVFLPGPEKANGAAIVMLPGGGLRVLSMGADMHDTIALMNESGIAVFVLEYRTLQLMPAEIARMTAPRPATAGPVEFPKMEIRKANANPSPDDPALNEVLGFAVDDGQQALRLVRRHAADWNIDPDRVGMFGTSAGGGVAFGTMMANVEGAKPDFIISNFGPALQDITVPKDAPPVFLITEAWHGPVTDGLIALFQMWIEERKSAELHVYEVPNFSMTPDLWGGRLLDWMKERELLAQPEQ
jgi:hypothetical protein